MARWISALLDSVFLENSHHWGSRRSYRHHGVPGVQRDFTVKTFSDSHPDILWMPSLPSLEKF
ncbi:hypothetical protein BGY98DRAFT_967336 [Russula aff. rugulosa BPL654]|nr:hypothetical protein BGY98DRAFT_967336 [Russula aff. rugulosa BPL654]